MSGSASKRITQLFDALKQEYARGGSPGPALDLHLVVLEILALKQYLDELADGRPVTEAPKE